MAIEEDVELPLATGRTIPAFLARPEPSEGPVPGVLVLHDILGLSEDIRRIARRFSVEGYAALAPDLFTGRGPKAVCILRTLAAISRGRGPVVQDLLDARDWLARRDGIDGTRIGVAGFCMGGGFALLLGSLGDFGAAADFYGDVAADEDRYRDICPVVAGYGARDLLFARKAALLETHLRKLGVSHDIVVYDGAGHSYMNQLTGLMLALAPFSPLRSGYDEAASEDSWRRMLSFFRHHLPDMTELGALDERST